MSTIIGLSAAGLTGEGLQKLTQPGNWQLNIAGQLSTALPVRETENLPEKNTSLSDIPAIPLPSPDAQGRLVLQPGVRYLASDLPVVGPLMVCVSADSGPKLRLGKCDY